MSLKAIHVFLIGLSILLAFGFGVWGFLDGSMLYLILGVVSVALGVALVAYLIRFLKKLKHVGFM